MDDVGHQFGAKVASFELIHMNGMTIIINNKCRFLTFARSLILVGSFVVSRPGV